MMRLSAMAAVLTFVATVGLVSAQSSGQRFGIGTPASPDQIAALDIDVRPDGTGLPPGSGTAAQGAMIYTARCASCHGANGEGGVADALVGPEPKGTAPFGPEYERWRNGRSDVPFTIGNYWPYATTVFDYVRRAMPATAPGTLTADETYSLVAWLLAKNQVITTDAVVDAETLPRIRMPARDRFVPDNRNGGAVVK